MSVKFSSRTYGPENNRAHNLDLLSDVFEAAYRTLREARGTRHTESTEYYLDSAAIRNAVEGAIRKAECDALDSWRNAQLINTKQSQP